MIAVCCQVGGWQHALNSSLFWTEVLCPHKDNWQIFHKKTNEHLSFHIISLLSPRKIIIFWKVSHTLGICVLVKYIWVSFFKKTWDVFRLGTFYGWDILHLGCSTVGTFSGLGHSDPFDILYLGCFEVRMFWGFGRFVAWTCWVGMFCSGTLCLRTFCSWDFCLRTFVFETFCSGDVLRLMTFWGFWRFLFGAFWSWDVSRLGLLCSWDVLYLGRFVAGTVWGWECSVLRSSLVYRFLNFSFRESFTYTNISPK